MSLSFFKTTNEQKRGFTNLILPFFKRYRNRIGAGLAALLLVDGLQLAIPKFIEKAVDLMEISGASRAELNIYAIWILVCALLIVVCRFTWRTAILGFSRLIERGIRNQIFNHVLSLDAAFFQRSPPGRIMALATNDLTAVQMACGMGLVACLDAVVMTCAALACMAYINPLLTLIAVLPMPALAFLSRILSRHLHHRFARVQEQFARLSEFARDSISSIKLIKAYTQEKTFENRFTLLGEQYIKENLGLARVQSTLFPASSLAGNLSLLLILLFGGRLTIHGVISGGEFVAFISYIYLLTWPIMAIGWVLTLFQRGITSLGRLQEVMEERPVLKETTDPWKVKKLRGTIQCKELSFSYPDQNRLILDKFSCCFRAGRITGITGPSGSGKTTLCRILTRTYPVSRDMLFFSAIDVNDLKISTIREAIAYVAQDTILFSDTIAANIAFGRPDSDQEKVEEIAAACFLHDEILQMTEGYQTRLGEKGVTISGGQRQRLALARALILDRPYLIIDDGLSAVDFKTEKQIMAAIIPWLKGKTCILISHRWTPLELADQIIIMEEGRVSGIGTPEELKQKNSYYQKMLAAGNKR
ncbi:MAG: ABC transporter ATP-binding protein [Thermodesulfobacteriota bacterium]